MESWSHAFLGQAFLGAFLCPFFPPFLAAFLVRGFLTLGAAAFFAAFAIQN